MKYFGVLGRTEDSPLFRHMPQLVRPYLSIPKTPDKLHVLHQQASWDVSLMAQNSLSSDHMNRGLNICNDLIIKRFQSMISKLSVITTVTHMPSLQILLSTFAITCLFMKSSNVGSYQWFSCILYQCCFIVPNLKQLRIHCNHPYHSLS